MHHEVVLPVPGKNLVIEVEPAASPFGKGRMHRLTFIPHALKNVYWNFYTANFNTRII
jgi:peptidase E